MNSDSCNESDQENGKETTARGYQNEIFEDCIERNTIVYLPTGAGKTHIAIMVLKYLAEDLQPPIENGGKRSVFLTTTVALASQQYEYICKATPFRVALFTGGVKEDNMKIDDWDRATWRNGFNKNQVVVATCDLFLRVIISGHLKFENFNLIVFDECHNAAKDHPMAKIMDQYRQYPEANRPRILGLSGSLTSASVQLQDVSKDLKRLESTLCATISTIKNDGQYTYNDVLTYSTKPKEKTVPYKTKKPSPVVVYLKAKMKEVLVEIGHWMTSEGKRSKTKKMIQELSKLCNDFLVHSDDLGKKFVWRFILFTGTRCGLRTEETELCSAQPKLQMGYLITVCEEMLHIAFNSMNIDGGTEEESESNNYSNNSDPSTHKNDDDDDDDSSENNEISGDDETFGDSEQILKYSSPKVVELLTVLKKSFKKRTDVKGLIFVERRSTARHLTEIINKYARAEKLQFCTDFVLGANAKRLNPTDAITSNLASKSNKIVLEKFKVDEIQLIVTTSVLEEGIDLQECNLVICFDPPDNFRSYIQSKGRARMKESAYMVLTAADEVIEIESNLAKWREVSKSLREHLVDSAVEREPPTQEAIDDAHTKRYNKIYETKTGAVIDYGSAARILNVYTQAVEKYRPLKPIWKTRSADGYVFSVELPIILKQDTLKFQGDKMPSQKWGKKSVAFKACVELHRMGELDDHLEPVTAETILEKYHEVYFQSWNAFKNDPESAGTKDHHRSYEICQPEELCNSIPQIQKQLYLYVFGIQTNIPDSGDDNVAVFRKLFESNRSYGILTAKPLPRLGLMKFYQSFGEISCKMNYQPQLIALTNDHALEALKRFHCILFRDVLDIWKSFLVYDKNHSIIIVPTIGEQIDWQIVNSFQTWSPIKKLSEPERRGRVYHSKDWLHKVVVPLHRSNCETERYIVTRVLDKTPQSPFPGDEYESFAAYYEKKYEATVVECNQFLIEVKGITRNLNLLNAGGGESGRKNKKAFSLKLIPEFCHNFNFPGDSWLKATLLPSILFRLPYLLHAEKLRNKINRYVGIEIENYEPKPVLTETKRKKKPQDVAPRTSKDHSKDSEQCDPIDVDRNCRRLTMLDLDYVAHYRKIEREKLEYETSMSSQPYQRLPGLLCDVPSNNEWQIKLLEPKSPSAGVEQCDLLAAITPKSTNDVFDSDRPELLGDSFLKFIVSLYLLQNHSDYPEGILTKLKAKIVSNRNFCYKAINFGLPKIIRTESFQLSIYSNWQLPMLKVDDWIKTFMLQHDINPDLLNQLNFNLSQTDIEGGEISQETQAIVEQCFMEVDDKQSPLDTFFDLQTINDKTCSDSIEAILGVCLGSIGLKTLKILEMFHILPSNDNKDIAKMLEIKLRSPRIRANISDAEVDKFLVNYDQLEQNIGYKFKDRAYLLQALTHPSYIANKATGNYQLLEFLGDAILDFLIIAYIYERCPHMSPGKLSDLRQALVNNATLACMCVRYKIDSHVLHADQTLATIIARFVDFQINRKHELSAPIVIGSDAEIAEYIKVPEALSDVFEALLGSIFVDSGNDLKTVWKVVYRLYGELLDKFMADPPIQAKRELEEYTRVRHEFDEPIRRTENGAEYTVLKLHFTHYGQSKTVYGIGDNNKVAKEAAARLALNILKNQTN